LLVGALFQLFVRLLAAPMMQRTGTYTTSFLEVTFLIRAFRGCVPGWPYPANEKHFYSLVTFSQKMT